MFAMTQTRKSTKSRKSSTGAKRELKAHQPGDGFSAEERAAMKERAAELAAAARGGKGRAKADTGAEVIAKIAEMPEPDRGMAERLHAIVKASAPELTPRL